MKVAQKYILRSKTKLTEITLCTKQNSLIKFLRKLKSNVKMKGFILIAIFREKKINNSKLKSIPLKNKLTIKVTTEKTYLRPIINFIHEITQHTRN